MTHSENSTVQPHWSSVAIRMLAGATIGLILISVFLFSAGEGRPAWGKLWVIRPMIMVTLAGAMGGFCNYSILHFRSLVGVNKVVAMIISVIVFVIGLWIGTVVGLDGTLWN